MIAALTIGASAGSPAIYGFDVVAYQSLPASASGVKGSAEFAFNLTSKDMTNTTSGERMEDTAYEFHFANASNLATFKADPWRYTPAWGGF